MFSCVLQCNASGEGVAWDGMVCGLDFEDLSSKISIMSRNKLVYGWK